MASGGFSRFSNRSKAASGSQPSEKVVPKEASTVEGEAAVVGATTQHSDVNMGVNDSNDFSDDFSDEFEDAFENEFVVKDLFQQGGEEIDSPAHSLSSAMESGGGLLSNKPKAAIADKVLMDSTVDVGKKNQLLALNHHSSTAQAGGLVVGETTGAFKTNKGAEEPNPRPGCLTVASGAKRVQDLQFSKPRLGITEPCENGSPSISPPQERVNGVVSVATASESQSCLVTPSEMGRPQCEQASANNNESAAAQDDPSSKTPPSKNLIHQFDKGGSTPAVVSKRMIVADESIHAASTAREADIHNTSPSNDSNRASFLDTATHDNDDNDTVMQEVDPQDLSSTSPTTVVVKTTSFDDMFSQFLLDLRDSNDIQERGQARLVDRNVQLASFYSKALEQKGEMMDLIDEFDEIQTLVETARATMV